MSFGIQMQLRAIVVLLVALCFGCGDEAEPNLPTILGQSSSAECRDDNGVSKLDYIEVAVLDFDGAEDLGNAEVRVLSSILSMEKEPAVYQPSLDEAGTLWDRPAVLRASFVSLDTFGDDAPTLSKYFASWMSHSEYFSVSDASGHEVSGFLLAEPVMD